MLRPQPLELLKCLILVKGKQTNGTFHSLPAFSRSNSSIYSQGLITAQNTLSTNLVFVFIETLHCPIYAQRRYSSLASTFPSLLVLLESWRESWRDCRLKNKEHSSIGSCVAGHGDSAFKTAFSWSEQY